MWKRPEIRPFPRSSLLRFGGRARVFELLLDGLGLVLADVLLDRLRRAVDQVLGLLEAETGDLANGLDDVDLRGTGLLQDHGELGLLLLGLGRGAAAGAGSRRDGDRCRGHAPALLEELAELRDLEDRETLDLLDQLVELLCLN